MEGGVSVLKGKLPTALSYLGLESAGRMPYKESAANVACTSKVIVLLQLGRV